MGGGEKLEPLANDLMKGQGDYKQYACWERQRGNKYLLKAVSKFVVLSCEERLWREERRSEKSLRKAAFTGLQQVRF